MHAGLAKKLCAELESLMQQCIAKNADALDDKRKVTKATDDMDAHDLVSPTAAASSPSAGLGRIDCWSSAGKPPAGRPFRCGSAPPPRSSQQSDEDLILVKLPDAAHEVVARAWCEDVLQKLTDTFVPTETTNYSFHDNLALMFMDAQSANTCAVALRGCPDGACPVGACNPRSPSAYSALRPWLRHPSL